MLVTLGWMLLAGWPPPVALAGHAAAGWVSVWTDREDPYERGDRVRLYLRADAPSYVTVLRVDTDGRLRVLFPRDPWGDNYVRGGRTLEVAGARGGRAFRVDDEPGIGYVVAIASPVPFDYDDIARGDYWDYRLIDGGRIEGDPYVALTDLAERITADGRYDYDISPYYVHRRYDYPRFVCYDCHATARSENWDPYRDECVRFRIVVYDHPTYYPYRYNRGRNVVVARPLHPGPRFVFRHATPGGAYVTRLQGRPDESDRRRARELSPVRPLIERHRTEERWAEPRRAEPRGAEARRAEPRRERPEKTRAAPARRPNREPRSTGEPELRRRKPE